jgi:hypothetical protein
MGYILGMTFEQLHNDSTAQMNEHQVKYTIQQLHQTLAGLEDLFKPEEKKEFYKIFEDRLKTIFDELCDDEYYVALRAIYDTEEKFLMMSRVLDRVGEAQPRITGLLASIIDEMDLAAGE